VRGDVHAAAQACIEELEGQLEQTGDQIGGQHMRLQEAAKRIAELEAKVESLDILVEELHKTCPSSNT
jgi:archaellum component FlaC